MESRVTMYRNGAKEVGSVQAIIHGYMLQLLPAFGFASYDIWPLPPPSFIQMDELFAESNMLTMSVS